MSIQSWKAEFLAGLHDVTEEDALAHAIRKWEGLKPENLAKHGVRIVGGGEIESESESKSAYGRLWLGGATCALCRIYVASDDYPPDEYDGCSQCPLFKVRGAPCDQACPEDLPFDPEVDHEEADRSPWRQFANKKRIEPMIMWLAKAAESAVKK